MEAPELLHTIQREIFELQEKLNLLQEMVAAPACKNLLTRQEAADFLGKTTRQLDRDCRVYGIPKIYANGGVRIRRIDLLLYMGEINIEDMPRKSAFERIIGK